MPNVAQGATASYTFPTAQTVTFTLDQGERAVINVTRSGALIANRSISNGETVGPYQAGDVMSVTALRGAVDYDFPTYTPPVSGDGRTESWSDLVALSGSAPVGSVYRVASPVIAGGMSGTAWVRTASGWAPACEQTLWASLTTVTGTPGGSTAWQPMRQLSIPAGVLRVANGLHVYCKFGKNSVTDPANITMRIHVGASGTSSDEVVFSNTMSGGSRSAHGVVLGAWVGNTTMRPWPYSLTGSFGTEQSVTSGTPGADVTTSDVSAPCFITASMQQGASPVATVQLEAMFVKVW